LFKRLQPQSHNQAWRSQKGKYLVLTLSLYVANFVYTDETSFCRSYLGHDRGLVSTSSTQIRNLGTVSKLLRCWESWKSCNIFKTPRFLVFINILFLLSICLLSIHFHLFLLNVSHWYCKIQVSGSFSIHFFESNLDKVAGIVSGNRVPVDWFRKSGFFLYCGSQILS